ncbi:MAG: TIGR00159 family protein, partial [Desulfovibrio sp.]|nr:TIGR00159 family protein [Desulfovibrio sp.]
MELPFTSLSLSWRDVLDISLVTLLFYHLILMVKQTRAVSAIYGLLILIIAYFLSNRIGLVTLNLLLENVLGSLFLIVIIVFQRDIRQALTSIGSRQWGFWGWFRKRGMDPVVLIISESAV